MPLKHIEFVPISPGRALAILVGAGGTVENRVINVPQGLPPSALLEASNYLSARLQGKTIDSAKSEILQEVEQQRAELDQLTARIVAEGLATLSARPQEGNDPAGDKILIVRGASNLLDEVERRELGRDDGDARAVLEEAVEDALEDDALPGPVLALDDDERTRG